jgi:hypothetical protein
MKAFLWSAVVTAVLALSANTACADSFFFTTNDPDGKMAMASRPGSAGKLEIEAADDFLLTSETKITGGSFTGLLSGATLSDIVDVRIEIYRVFPNDSTVPPSGHVPTRNNSPSDVEFADRSASASTLSFTPAIVNSTFNAANSVLNGIHPFPNQTTQGDGPVSGQEVKFNVDFTTPFTLPADHYFFVPQVQLANGDFYWLSSPKPIDPGGSPPGTPFLPDLQTWIRNEDLAPDWLRVGTDIVGGNPAPQFNATFSLSGQTIPEPSSLVILGTGVAVLAACSRRRFVKSAEGSAGRGR